MATFSLFRARLAALPRLAAKLIRHGVPRHLLMFGPVSIGDDLLCTTIARELARRGQRQTWIMSRHPELFLHNPDVERVIPIDDYHARLLRRLGATLTQPYYFRESPDRTRYLPPSRPIIAEMCALAGLSGQVDLRPWLNLTSAEKTRGALHTRQVVMHTSGQSAGSAMANKDWIPQRFQEVADRLASSYSIVQLGAPGDPAIHGAQDLRGKTSLRESAAIVSAARVVVCQVGFLMHLARAVDTRAVVIYGGVEHPAITGYAANENLYSPVDCAPCWMPNNCPASHKCMTAIDVQRVVEAVSRADAKLGEVLPVEKATLPSL